MKKIIYNNKVCGLFLLTDLFEISSGKGTLSKEGKYPQITSTTSNNGHGGLTNKVDAENAFTITYNGFPGYCFWHNYKFGANSDCIIAKQKINIPNNYCAIYIAAIITSYLKPRYSYGRKASQSRLKNQYIPLPIKDNGTIDFEYMELTVKPLIQNKINNLIDNFK